MNTIHDLELALECGLLALRGVKLNDDGETAKEFLLPEGLSPVVEIVHDNLRKKRSSAAAWNWNPLTDKVIISFRPSAAPSMVQAAGLAPDSIAGASPSEASVADKSESALVLSVPNPSVPAPPPVPIVEAAPERAEATVVSAQEIIECCQALAQAEKSNRHFIAIKWFRDELLATVGFSWAQSQQRRQQVLSQAIAMGRIDLKKIPNPKLPDYPTTAISLNRSIPIPGVTSRFNPVPIRGEAASLTLLADRGPA